MLQYTVQIYLLTKSSTTFLVCVVNSCLWNYFLALEHLLQSIEACHNAMELIKCSFWQQITWLWDMGKFSASLVYVQLCGCLSPQCWNHSSKSLTTQYTMWILSNWTPFQNNRRQLEGSLESKSYLISDKKFTKRNQHAKNITDLSF